MKPARADRVRELNEDMNVAGAAVVRGWAAVAVFEALRSAAASAAAVLGIRALLLRWVLELLVSTFPFRATRRFSAATVQRWSGASPPTDKAGVLTPSECLGDEPTFRRAYRRRFRRFGLSILEGNFRRHGRPYVSCLTVAASADRA